MTPNPLSQPTILRFNWLSVGFLILLSCLIPVFVFGGTPFIVDDFEEYANGNLTGQGDWEELAGGYDPLQVNVDKAQSGDKSVRDTNAWSGNIRSRSNVINGTQSFWIYFTNNNAITYGLWKDAVRKFYIHNETATKIIKISSSGALCNYTENEWTSFQVEWDGGTGKIRYNCNFEGWSDWGNYGAFGIGDYINKLSIASYKLNYCDNLAGEFVPELEIIGISPNSGSEITSFDTNLTIEYRYFDWDIYDGFIVNFIDNKIGSLGNSVLFEKDDLDPSGTGQKTIGLTDFGIDSNGRWDLTGLGFGTKLDIEGGMFLTTRGYIDFWTDELVKETYYLIINVEGLPEFYTFTDAPTWYGANVDRFDTPTAFFTSFISLMTPTFEKLGEFGRKTLTLFDSNESYDRGYALGEIFPLINAYIKKIDLFFGGFPLASFFKYLILLMFAGFIIRTILKFIPMLG